MQTYKQILVLGYINFDTLINLSIINYFPKYDEKSFSFFCLKKAYKFTAEILDSKGDKDAPISFSIAIKIYNDIQIVGLLQLISNPYN